eukprot:1791563-Pyramimonas_sp.AAC.1
MFHDIVRAAQPHGQELHPSKTMILNNQTRRTGRAISRTTRVQAKDIDILPHDGNIKYLGHFTNFQDAMKTDVGHLSLIHI